MAISRGLESRGPKTPILLKGTGQSLCLEVKVGGLGLELWTFPNEEAQPYARLLFARERNEIADDQTEEERRRWTVILNWQKCCTVSGAIQDWLSFPESGIEEHHEPALHMELASLTFDFYRQSERGSRKFGQCGKW
jgi:hypothetical protein